MGRTFRSASHLGALKPYPEYKDSGVPWLDRIPEHWDIGPGFSAFREKKVKNSGMIESQVLSLSYGKIVIKPPEKLHGLVPASFETYQVVDPNDIIVRPTDLQNDWTSLRVGLARDRGIITSAYLCLQTVESTIPHYGYLLLHAYDLKKIFYGMGSGLRQNLDFSDLKRMPVLTPPIDEQRAIAHFLDHYDRLIRRYIRAQRRLIELLEEQKQALIQRAVTRGLDPDAPLKDSGVEWVGKIPVNWEVQTLSRLVQNIEQGWSPVAAEGAINIDQWAVLTLSAVKRGKFHPGAFKPISRTADIPDSIEVHPGDFLLTRSNTRKLVGDVCVVDRVRPRTVLCDLIYRLSIDNSRLLPRFLMYWMLSPFGRFQIEADARGSSQTMVKLSQGHIRRWRILRPPLREQALIVDYLDQISHKWERSTTRLEQRIDLIREYRTRLIADVVTGKLDVRGVTLPDLDAEEPDE